MGLFLKSWCSRLPYRLSKCLLGRQVVLWICGLKWSNHESLAPWKSCHDLAVHSVFIMWEVHPNFFVTQAREQKLLTMFISRSELYQCLDSSGHILENLILLIYCGIKKGWSSEVSSVFPWIQYQRNLWWTDIHFRSPTLYI